MNNNRAKGPKSATYLKSSLYLILYFFLLFLFGIFILCLYYKEKQFSIMTEITGKKKIEFSGWERMFLESAERRAQKATVCMKSQRSSLSHFDFFPGVLLHPLDFSRSIPLSSSPSEEDHLLYLFSGRGFLLPLFFSIRSSSPFATHRVYSQGLSLSRRERDWSLIFSNISLPPYSSSIERRAFK